MKNTLSLAVLEKAINIFTPILIGFVVFLTVWELAQDILRYDVYQAMFAWLSPQETFFRYTFSIFSRELYILAGILVLLRKDVGRRILIFLSLFTVVTVYWKHPYHAFVNANLYFHTNAAEFQQTIVFPWAPDKVYYPGMLMRVVHAYIWDIFINLFVAGILLVPLVRSKFRTNRGE